MRQLKTGLSLFLIVMLCFTLLPVSAFADTQIVIGGQIPSSAQVVGGPDDSSAIIVGSDSSVSTLPAPDAADSSVFVAGQNTTGKEPSQAVIVSPDGKADTPFTLEDSAAAANAGNAPANVVPAGLRAEVFAIVNQARIENGLQPLSYNSSLQQAAETRAKECAVSFSHVRPDGSASETVITTNYTYAGENLILVTSEYAAADLLLDTWMQSGIHQANILNSAYTQTAVGLYEADGTTYVAQVFIG